MKDLLAKGDAVDTGVREEGRHVELRSGEPRTSGSQTWLPILALPGELYIDSCLLPRSSDLSGLE